MCVCRMVCVLVLDGRGVGQSWARLVVVGSWLLFVIHRLLVDWTCGVGQSWAKLGKIGFCWFLVVICYSSVVG